MCTPSQPARNLSMAARKVRERLTPVSPAVERPQRGALDFGAAEIKGDEPRDKDDVEDQIGQAHRPTSLTKHCRTQRQAHARCHEDRRIRQREQDRHHGRQHPPVAAPTGAAATTILPVPAVSESRAGRTRTASLRHCGGPGKMRLRNTATANSKKPPPAQQPRCKMPEQHDARQPANSRKQPERPLRKDKQLDRR